MTDLLAEDTIGHKHHVCSQQPLQLRLIGMLCLARLILRACCLLISGPLGCCIGIAPYYGSLSLPDLLQRSSN